MMRKKYKSRVFSTFFVLFFVNYSSAAQALTCEELDQFLIGLALARSVNTNLSASRTKVLSFEDSTYTAKEKPIISKYIDRAFSKADPAEGAFVIVDSKDCTK